MAHRSPLDNLTNCYVNNDFQGKNTNVIVNYKAVTKSKIIVLTEQSRNNFTAFFIPSI